MVEQAVQHLTGAIQRGQFIQKIWRALPDSDIKPIIISLQTVAEHPQRRGPDRQQC